jgi:hypothetical protein
MMDIDEDELVWLEQDPVDIKKFVWNIDIESFQNNEDQR